MRTRSIAAVNFLGDPQAPQFAAEIDRHDALAASLEGVAGIVVAVAHFIERVADAVMIAQTGLLTRLEAQGIRLVDLALGFDAGRHSRRRGSHHEACHEAGEATGQSDRHGTHFNTHTRFGMATPKADRPGFSERHESTPFLSAETVKLT